MQIAGDGREAERLLLISRPSGGRVRVREWTGGVGPRESELGVEAVHASIARAVDAGRRVSQELYRIRQWLDGTR